MFFFSKSLPCVSQFPFRADKLSLGCLLSPTGDSATSCPLSFLSVLSALVQASLHHVTLPEAILTDVSSPQKGHRYQQTKDDPTKSSDPVSFLGHQQECSRLSGS